MMIKGRSVVGAGGEQTKAMKEQEVSTHSF